MFEFDYLKKDNQWFPLIDIVLKGPKRARAFKALVDSGASYSVFRGEVGVRLGIEVESGGVVYLTGIGGRILGYLHKVPIKIGDQDFICKVIFSKELTVSFNILGRDNFFIPFLITFDEKLRKVLIKKN